MYKQGRGSVAPTLLSHFYLQVFVSLVPTRVGWGGVGCTGQEQDRLEDTQDQRPGGAGWGGADDVQVSSKTDLRIHKTKGWGGVGWS